MSVTGFYTEDEPDLDSLSSENQSVNHIASFKYHEIKSWVLDGRFDILVISEIKINSIFPDSQFDIPGFKMCCADRNKHGGTLMVYIHTDSHCKVVQDLLNLPLSKPAGYKTESIILKIMIGKTWETIAGIYHLPTSAEVPKSISMVELESILEAIAPTPGNCLLVGDFNSDLNNPDKGTQDGQTLLDIYDLYNIIDSLTRITKTSISLLDLVITNNKNKISASGVIHCK